MTKQSLTAASIDALPHPETGQKIYWDAKQAGFGVRVTPGAKAFIVQNRVGGKTRRVKVANVGTMSVAEARKEAQKQLGQMATGTDPNALKAEAKAKTLTFGQAVSMYVSDRSLKASTVKHYRNCMDWYLSDWQSRQIKDVTPAAVVQRFDRITKEHGASVANVVFRYVRAIYNHALAATKTNEGIATLPANPVARLSDLKRWHKPKSRDGHVTDFAAFFAAVEIAAATNSNRFPNAGADFADFVDLLLRTGLRKAEASNLRWADIDLSADTLTVIAERAKNGKALTLPMSTQTVAILERLQERHTEGEFIWGTSPLGDPRKTLEKAREALGEQFSFHDLRRSFAIQAEAIGTPYTLLKRMLNHSGAGDVTTGHYLKSDDPETLRPYVQQVSDRIDDLAKP